MTSGLWRIAALGVAAALLAGACSGALATQPVGGRGPTGIVALLLPDKAAVRYEASDSPLFESEFSKVCPNATVDEQNADGDGPMQQFQVEAEIAKGARVVVVDPVDGSKLGSVLSDAAAQAVKVISYDRLITAPGSRPDAFIGFDLGQAGELQGKALLARFAASGPARPRVIWINGPRLDPSSAPVAAGAHSALAGRVDIVAEADMGSSQAGAAQAVMASAIGRVGANGYDAVYVPTDDGAAGVVAAERAAGIDPASKPVTGLGGQLDALRRVLAGSQAITVYEPAGLEAVKAADLACNALGGPLPPTGTTTSNGTIDVPSYLLTPLAVSATGSIAGTVSIEDSVVRDRVFGPTTVAQICSGGLAASCAGAGIK